MITRVLDNALLFSNFQAVFIAGVISLSVWGILGKLWLGVLLCSFTCSFLWVVNGVGHYMIPPLFLFCLLTIFEPSRDVQTLHSFCVYSDSASMLSGLEVHDPVGMALLGHE